jgi:hypothetical protein
MLSYNSTSNVFMNNTNHQIKSLYLFFIINSLIILFVFFFVFLILNRLVEYELTLKLGFKNYLLIFVYNVFLILLYYKDLYKEYMFHKVNSFKWGFSDFVVRSIVSVFILKAATVSYLILLLLFD